jgi:hypothetical protein
MRHARLILSSGVSLSQLVDYLRLSGEGAVPKTSLGSMEGLPSIRFAGRVPDPS